VNSTSARGQRPSTSSPPRMPRLE